MLLVLLSTNIFVVFNVRCMLYLYTGRVFLSLIASWRAIFPWDVLWKKTEFSRVLIASIRHCVLKISAFCQDMGLHYISLFYAAAITVVKCLLWTSITTIRNVSSSYNFYVGFNILIRWHCIGNHLQKHQKLQ
jgi:hypothetical protein